MWCDHFTGESKSLLLRDSCLAVLLNHWESLKKILHPGLTPNQLSKNWVTDLMGLGLDFSLSLSVFLFLSHCLSFNLLHSFFCLEII